MTIWHSLPSSEARVLAELVAPLQAAHPDWEMATEAQQPDTVLEQFGNADGPDAALIPLSAVRTLIREHRVLPLDAYLSERDRLDFLPVAWKHVTREGHTWAVPFELSSLALFYNRSILAQAGMAVPATTTDLMLRGMVFHAKQPQQAFMSLPTEPMTLLPFLWAHGGTVLADVRWRIATQYLMTLRSRQVVGPFHQTQKSCIDVLAAGRAAMAIGSPENLPQLNAMSASGDLGVAPLPNGSDSVHTPMVGRVWVVSPKADRLDAALAAVAALSSRESAALWNARLSRMPARSSAYDEPAIVQRPALAVFRDQAATARVLTESDLVAVAALAPQWRPYLTGQKKLEMPKSPMSRQPSPSPAPKQPTVGRR